VDELNPRLTRRTLVVNEASVVLHLNPHPFKYKRVRHPTAEVHSWRRAT
jgi:hypothetical protein